MTAQRLLVESGNRDVAEDLYEIIKNFETDEIGLNSPAVHALWTLHGLGLLDGDNEEALQIAYMALRHPASGVRKAAVEVLPKVEASALAVRGNDLITDQDLNVRMRALLALAEMPTSSTVGEMLYEASLVPENAEDDWITKALFAAVTQHDKHFKEASGKSGAKESDLNRRLLSAIEKEIYELGRRSVLQFSPEMANKEIIIQTSVSQRGDKEVEGVIVAQGGKENGYSLYIEDGKVNFVVNREGKAYKADYSQPLPENYELVAQIARDGQISLEI